MQYEVPAGRFFKSQGSAHTLTAEFSIFYAWSLFFSFPFCSLVKLGPTHVGVFSLYFCKWKEQKQEEGFFLPDLSQQG